MDNAINYRKTINELSSIDNLLIIQDIDGVCLPLVNDPLTRKIDKSYVMTASQLKDEFMVLTCGEHEGKRGVNRIIERAVSSKEEVKKKGLYLPGLAACGIEYQDRYGNISCPGLTDAEKDFLLKVPVKMKSLLIERISILFPNISSENIAKEADQAICDTRYSPTINLNSLFLRARNNLELKRDLQKMLEEIMNEVIDYSNSCGLKNSFYLHKSPNLGKKNGIEVIKYAQKNDIGTTDIQMIINGCLKEIGLIVLINKYLGKKTGSYPLGEDFNVKVAPREIKELILLCKEKINQNDMPTIIGVGDTVTSVRDSSNTHWMRGGSDRNFLTLIQFLGLEFRKNNTVIFVDSSDGEVNRPSTKLSGLKGITDKEDPLNLNLVLSNGHKEYIAFLKEFMESRSKHS